MDLPENQRFGMHRRRTSWPLAVLIVLMHLAVLYGLALALAPQMTVAVRTQATAAFSISPPPPAPDPRATPAAPDRGAQGDPGPDAVARPGAAPPPRLPVKADRPLPRAASIGIASLSGAAAAGEGTGAVGLGAGTGSGNGGEGRGGGVAAGPVHTSGAIDNARDFPLPEGGRAARRGTQVIVRVTIGTDGRARDCAIIRPSPDPEADRITCRLVESRLGFRPAKDASGNPVPAPFYWRQQWF